MAGKSATASEDCATKTKNVLIAIDGSQHSINTFEWFVEHLYRPTDNVIMAYCADKMPNMSIVAENPSMFESMIDKHQEQVTKVLQIFDQLARKHNIKHTSERLDGSPGEAIIKAAEKHNCHVILAGSRGLGTIRRTILGSVSDFILHHSKVPVLVCKHANTQTS